MPVSILAVLFLRCRQSADDVPPILRRIPPGRCRAVRGSLILHTAAAAAASAPSSSSRGSLLLELLRVGY